MEKLMREADELFQTVSFLGNFTITGGEPLLYDSLTELLEYIGKKYRKQIGSFTIITNGTMQPGNNLLEIMQKYDIEVDVSDYTDAIPEKKESIINHVNCYRSSGIKTYFLNNAEWVDFGFKEVINDFTEEQGMKFFDTCRTRCRGFVDGKIRYCINAYFAAKALGMKEDQDNAFEIGNVHVQNCDQKKQLVEYDLGYNNRGCLEMCYHCNGTCEINKHKIEVGKQCRNH